MAQSQRQRQRQRPDLYYQIGRQTLPSRNLQTHKGVSSPHTHWSAPTTPTSRHFYGYNYHDHHFENEQKSIIKRAKEKAKRWRYSILRRKGGNKHENDNKPPQVSSAQETDENHGATNYGLTREEDESKILYLSSNSSSTRITSQANGNWEIEMKQANDVAKQPCIAASNNTPKDTKPMVFPSTANNNNMNQAPAAAAAWSTFVTNEHNNSSEKMMLIPPTTTISEYPVNQCSLLGETKMKTVNPETTTSTSIANCGDANCETKTLDPITTSIPSTTNDHNTVNEIVLETIDEPLIEDTLLSGTSTKNIDNVETLSPSPTPLVFVNGHETIDDVEALSQSLMSFGSIVNGHKTIGETLIETLAPAYTVALEATLLIASKIQESCPPIANAKRQVWNRGASMKEYLMNKLEPKEEDRALCDVITKAASLGKDISTSVKGEKHDFNSPLPI